MTHGGALHQSRPLQGLCKYLLPTESSRDSLCVLIAQTGENGPFSKGEANPGIWNVREGFLEEMALAQGMEVGGEKHFLGQGVGDLTEPWVQLNSISSMQGRAGWRKGSGPGDGVGV